MWDEKDQVFERAKRYHWKDQHLFMIWQDGVYEWHHDQKIEQHYETCPCKFEIFLGT
jgi:hypothetical protein